MEALVSVSLLSLVVFAFVFGGALLGMMLRAILPEPHLNADSRDVVRLSTGLIATLAALVIGLLIASAQSSFQTQINQITANVILLDNLLARSGPQAQPLRPLLRGGLKILVGESGASKIPVPPSLHHRSERAVGSVL